MKKYRKISNVKTHYHIDLEINGVVVDIDDASKRDVDYAVSNHNKMIERIEYLESITEKFLSGNKPDTSVKRVMFHEGCWGGNSFEVITGHGDVPNEFYAVSDGGVQVIARIGTKMVGGGHGEGSACAVLSYNVWQKDSDKYYNFDGQLFTVTGVVS